MTVGILGKHVLADFYECQFDLNDLDRIREICLEAAKVSGATVLSHNFHQFDPSGVTGVVCLQESHISIHTWPEKEDQYFTAVDFYTCGNCDPVAGMDYIRSVLAPKEAEIQVIERGRK